MKYLVTILDLRGSDLDFLKKMRSDSKELLRKNFGVAEDDVVKQYFHFPTDSLTATLHLHSRVNQYIMPIERTKAFSLDEIIAHLERGHNDIYDLIIDRAYSPVGMLWTSKIDFFEQMQRDQCRHAVELKRVGGFVNDCWQNDPEIMTNEGTARPSLPKDLFETRAMVQFWDQ